jgi:hypothetical protein
LGCVAINLSTTISDAGEYMKERRLRRWKREREYRLTETELENRRAEADGVGVETRQMILTGKLT